MMHDDNPFICLSVTLMLQAHILQDTLFSKNRKRMLLSTIKFALNVFILCSEEMSPSPNFILEAHFIIDSAD